MLLSLQIENFALVDRLELGFGRGLNVLTGETGAGKSIILDAIDVALGGKVSSRLLRTGSKKALIEATFALDSTLLEWLEAQEIDLLEDHSLICSRELSLSDTHFRARSRINGVLVNRKIISQLRDRLVEITAQGQTVNLLLPNRQRELLDLYGGPIVLEGRDRVTQIYETWKGAQKALEQQQKSAQEHLQRLDWLNYQIQELETVGLQDPEELNQLEQESDRLSHVVDLQKFSYQVYQILYQGDGEELSAMDLLGKSESYLQEMVQYDSHLNSILEMVQSALTQVVEAGQEIRRYGDNLEADPERLETVEERIRTLKQICRKYGPDLKDAIAHYQGLKTELTQLTNHEQSLEKLTKLCQTKEQELLTTCAQLTKHRQSAALRLQNQLITELKPLAMDKVRFECSLEPVPPNANGSDRVIYQFSPNPGEPLQPLSETASGGEMSRFLLALKACFSQTEINNSPKTLIFDEIDAGVSGKVAQAIAEKLHHLSQTQQILCVTHQPLIAALADTHFRVDKQIIDSISPLTVPKVKGTSTIEPEFADSLTDLRTVVRVTSLDQHESRREELAQLAGGHSAREAIAFAESLLTQAAARRR